MTPIVLTCFLLLGVATSALGANGVQVDTEYMNDRYRPRSHYESDYDSNKGSSIAPLTLRSRVRRRHRPLNSASENDSEFASHKNSETLTTDAVILAPLRRSTITKNNNNPSSSSSSHSSYSSFSSFSSSSFNSENNNENNNNIEIDAATEKLWCLASSPLEYGSICSDSWDPRNRFFQKCAAEQTCLGASCSIPLPGDPCESDADCGAVDSGCFAGQCALRSGQGSNVVSMRCLSKAKKCGFLSSVGEPCDSSNDCASGHCEDGKRCTGLKVGAPCNMTVPGNPCDRGLACDANGVCSEIEQRCQLLPPSASLEVVMDQCAPGMICQIDASDDHKKNGSKRAGDYDDDTLSGDPITTGKCVPFFSVQEGGSCAGPIGRLLCNETLSCTGPDTWSGGGATFGADHRCVDTRGQCNSTMHCPRSYSCRCPSDENNNNGDSFVESIEHTEQQRQKRQQHQNRQNQQNQQYSDVESKKGGKMGECVREGNGGCDDEFEQFYDCMIKYQCPNHEFFSVAATDTDTCANQCSSEYITWHCCLSETQDNYWTSMDCPAQYIKLGLSVGIMIGGAAIGLLIGLAVGCCWARRYSRINARFVKLAEKLKQNERRGIGNHNSPVKKYTM